MIAEVATLQSLTDIGLAGEVALVQLEIRIRCMRGTKRHDVWPIKTTHGMPLIE